MVWCRWSEQEFRRNEPPLSFLNSVIQESRCDPDWLNLLRSVDSLGVVGALGSCFFICVLSLGTTMVVSFCHGATYRSVHFVSKAGASCKTLVFAHLVCIGSTTFSSALQSETSPSLTQNASWAFQAAKLEVSLRPPGLNASLAQACKLKFAPHKYSNFL